MEKYKKELERFRRYAIYRGFSQYADDFASFAVEKMLKGRVTILRYSLVDFLRIYHDKELFYPMEEIETIQKGISHRAFNESSEQHQQFLKKLELKKKIITQKNPFISF